ncbi:hypothetical protein CEXT_344281 [Caerostris extrusa]|uniref:Secreted protein n=1 Tax=Caerostris extrusa TaxID=172846 RepID=A0AAV4TZU4_CAEEX|nr:hypothetical protein CEXT_344281 [Caerostris extrusa]
MSVNKRIFKILLRIILPLIFFFRPIPCYCAFRTLCSSDSYLLAESAPPIRSIATTPRKRRKKIHCSVSGCCAPAGVCIGCRELRNQPFRLK